MHSELQGSGAFGASQYSLFGDTDQGSCQKHIRPVDVKSGAFGASQYPVFGDMDRSSSSSQKHTPPVEAGMQDSDAFDASQYSFFGEMDPLNEILAGPLEVGLTPQPLLCSSNHTV
jgi:hypothetical protein